jgi:hypothetical protein
MAWQPGFREPVGTEKTIQNDRVFTAQATHHMLVTAILPSCLRLPIWHGPCGSGQWASVLPPPLAPFEIFCLYNFL